MISEGWIERRVEARMPFEPFRPVTRADERLPACGEGGGDAFVAVRAATVALICDRRVGLGPISTKMRAPCFTAAVTASEKSTGSRTLRHQYSPSSAVPSSAPPVTVERKVTSPSAWRRSARLRRSGASTAAMSALWKGYSRSSLRTRALKRRARPDRRSMSAFGPDTVKARGELHAAIEVSGNSARICSVTSREPITTAIPPRPNVSS